MCKPDPLLVTLPVLFKTLSFCVGIVGLGFLLTGMLHAQYYSTVSQTCPSQTRMRRLASIIDGSQYKNLFKTLVDDDETCRQVLFYGQERCEHDRKMRYQFGGTGAANSPATSGFNPEKCPKRWVAIPGAIICCFAWICALLDMFLMIIVISKRPKWGENFYNTNFIFQFVLSFVYIAGSALIIAFLITVALSDFPCKKESYRASSSLSFFSVHPSNRQRRSAGPRELPLVKEIPLTPQNLEFFLRGLKVPVPHEDERDTCAHLSTWVYRDIYVGLGVAFLLVAGICNLVSAIIGLIDKNRDKNQYSQTLKERVSENVGEGVEGVYASVIRRFSQ